VTALGAIAAAYWFKKKAQEPSKKLPEPWPEVRCVKQNACQLFQNHATAAVDLLVLCVIHVPAAA